MEDGWSLEELAERAGQALAADGVRAPNGRVSERPDARAIRWYATIGLVDRPRVGYRRASRYGPRHLLQVVAVKRRQAQGRSLAEIQAELAGATDEILRAVAHVPETLLADAPPAPAPAPRPRFWAAPATVTTGLAGSPSACPAPADRAAPAPVVRYVVPLAGDVDLALPAAPGEADLAAIAVAAAPLLDLLAERGLTLTSPPTPTPTKEHRDDGPAH